MCFVLTFQCLPGYCAGISVGNGASFHVGNATIDVNCLDLETAGQFVLGGGLVNEWVECPYQGPDYGQRAFSVGDPTLGSWHHSDLQ